TGWGPQEATGQSLEHIFHIINEETRQPVENPVTRVLREGVTVGLANHTLLIARDGREIPIDDSGAPIRGEEDSLAGVVLVFRDVTEARRSQKALQESEARKAAILETALDGIITIDEQGKVATFNPAAERLFGYKASEVIGQNVKMLMPEPYLSEHDTYLASYLHTGQAKIIGIGREVSGRRRDGSTFPLELAVSEFHQVNRRY